MKIIAGVDEAGRGPIAGPVVAAAVILPDGCAIEGVRDSKKISEKKREILHSKILDVATSVGVGIVHEDDIEELNILQATHRAMRLALGRLLPQPEEALIDGPGLPDQVVKNKGIIDGDDKVHTISAASIIAKVSRDRIMRNYDLIFPEYGFSKHKGYGTAEHLFNLRKHLACPIHRKGFRPVVNYMPSLSHLKESRLLEKWGKRLAARELIRNGYTVLEMNYSAAPYGEIDVVAKENDTVVFVEVKSASQKTLGRSEDQMNDPKLAKLFNAMNIYLSKNDSVADSRFDFMTVHFGKERPKVNHYKNCLD